MAKMPVIKFVIIEQNEYDRLKEIEWMYEELCK